MSFNYINRGMPLRYPKIFQSSSDAVSVACIHTHTVISHGRSTLLTMVNSPASTLLLYILDVNGSVLSLLPMIWAVEAVGIGAISRELRTPRAHRLQGK